MDPDPDPAPHQNDMDPHQTFYSMQTTVDFRYSTALSPYFRTNKVIYNLESSPSMYEVSSKTNATPPISKHFVFQNIFFGSTVLPVKFS